MKRLLFIFLFVFFVGCVTTPKPCPSETAYIAITVDGIVIPTRIKKGFFNNRKNYKNQKEFEAWLEKQRLLHYTLEKDKKGI